MSKKRAHAALAGLLVIMFLLLLGPMRQDSATVDETTFLTAGYSYWTGYRYYLVPDHAPLGQMLPALPLLAMDVRMSAPVQAIATGQQGYPWGVRWKGPPAALAQLFPQGRNNWYFVSTPESQIVGQMFVYGGTNDGEAMLRAGRLVQVLITLGIGALIFYWVRRVTAQDEWALLALAMWVFNPHALAYGHLIITDVSGALGMGAALYAFSLLLEKPTGRQAAVCGVLTGLALLLKYTAMMLAPMYLVLALIYRQSLRQAEIKRWKLGLVVVGAFWATIMLAYFPRWSPPPPISEGQAQLLGVPGWLLAFRPLLIPADFFKVLALKLAQSSWGHDGYLMGEWSTRGWWYYFPLGLVLKSPLAFIIAIIGAVALSLNRFRSMRPLELVPWVAAALYLGASMTSKVNVGVRHLLPIIPLLCIGIGCAATYATKETCRKIMYVLFGWQAVATVWVYPLYLQYYSELVGGAKNGYKYLVDSNYDWGQDAKRLKQFLDERGIQHIYLNYFGTQYSIEYLKIPNTRVSPEQARQIKQGVLVVSASELMRPGWDWLRESRQPIARVAHTLFVYQFP